MKRLIILASIVLTLFTVPAYADQLVPPTPNWWPSGGFDLRHGVWIACNHGDWNSDDCVDSIDVRSKTGGAWQPLIFTPNPNFSPDSTQQIPWGGGNDAAHLPQIDLSGPGYDGTWSTSGGLQTNDQNLPLVMDMGFFGSPQGAGNYYSWIQFNLRTTKWDVNLNDNLQYRVTFKSKFLEAYSRWTYSNSIDAQLDWSKPGFLSFIASPSLDYYPSADWDQTCAGNVVHSTASYQVKIVGLFISVFGNQKYQDPPSQLVGRTNGFMCNVTMSFDSSRSLLVMKLGNVQYDSNGNPIIGWVDMSIKSDLLQRLWHLDPKSTRGQATVEVTYLDGKKESVSTTATYDSAKDSLHLYSSGFHFPNAEVTLSIYPCKCTLNVGGAFVDTNGVWSAFDESYATSTSITKLKNGTHKVNVDFGPTYAGQSYSLSIVELIKGKRVYSKLTGFRLDSAGKGSALLKNNLVVGSTVLATSINRVTLATVSK